jgi:DNA gyrase/topoisomerase IV subunit A
MVNKAKMLEKIAELVKDKKNWGYYRNKRRIR